MVSSSRAGERSCCRKCQQECESLPQLRVAVTTGAVLSVLASCWRRAFVAPAGFSHHPCIAGKVALVTQPTPGTSPGFANVPPVSVLPSPGARGASWELGDRSWAQQEQEWQPILLPRDSLPRAGKAVSAAPACPLPCPAGDTELCRQSWTGPFGHPLPGAGNAGERGNGGAGREWRGQGGTEELELLPCRFADRCSLAQLGFACAGNLVIW